MTLEDEAEVAAAAGFAMTAGTAAETATSILGTDAMGRIGTREAANAIGTGTAETERVIADAHDPLVEGAHHHSAIFETEIPPSASTLRGLGGARETAAPPLLAHPTPTPPSVWLAAVSEEAGIEDAAAGTEAEGAAASTMTAIASDLAAAPKKAVGAATATSETVATDGSTLTPAETLETTVTPANVSY